MIQIGIDAKTKKPINLSQDSRARGVYLIGSTGSGKSTLLHSIAFQDMANGHGVIVLDPHGDLIEDLLLSVPENRHHDVVLLDAGDFDFPIPINLLNCDRDNPREVSRTISNLVFILRSMHKDSWGPRLELVLTKTLHIMMKIPGTTILDVLYFLDGSESYRRKILEILEEMEGEEGYFYSFVKRLIDSSQRSYEELTASTINKLTPFLLDESIRPIVGQSETSIDFRQMMDEKKIVLINLSKGKIGQNTSQLLGSVIINLILVSALSRQDLSKKEREENPIHLIVDEYQNFASDSFATLQSEARKYGVDLMVAHQFRDQLDIELQGSSLNVANFISMRVIGPDSAEMASQFDNTPPPGDVVFRPLMKPDPVKAGTFTAQKQHLKQRTPQRTYSDRQLEIANRLSTLPNFTGLARLVGENNKPVEHRFITVNPSGIDAERFYGQQNKSLPGHLRSLSRNRFKSREEAVLETESHFKKKLAVEMPSSGEIDLDEFEYRQ